MREREIRGGQARPCLMWGAEVCRESRQVWSSGSALLLRKATKQSCHLVVGGGSASADLQRTCTEPHATKLKRQALRGNIFTKEASESTHTDQCFKLGCQSIRLMHPSTFCLFVLSCFHAEMSSEISSSTSGRMSLLLSQRLDEQPDGIQGWSTRTGEWHFYWAYVCNQIFYSRTKLFHSV